MQGIFTYIPEKNHAPWEYSVAAYSVVTVFGAYIASSCVGSIVLLH